MNENNQKYSFLEKDYECVEFTNRIESRIKVHPIYYELGLSSSPLIYGRFGVLRRIHQVVTQLPPNFGVLIWDIYRPRAVQARLFAWMQEEVRKTFPNLTEEENYLETKKYVSLPSKVGDTYCPPHLSGGAIDLTLYDIESEQALDMGTPFDDCTERAHSDYFNHKSDLSSDEAVFKKNRNLLRETMESEGFTSYQHEWWHYDLGNMFWSNTTNLPQEFGPLFGDNELI